MKMNLILKNFSKDLVQERKMLLNYKRYEANKNKVNEIIKANSSEIRENVLKKIITQD